MIEKEKALELFEKFTLETGNETFAKQCALVAVYEILDILWHTRETECEYVYWQEVKEEIENL